MIEEFLVNLKPWQAVWIAALVAMLVMVYGIKFVRWLWPR